MNLVRFSSRGIDDRERASAIQEAYESIAKIQVEPRGDLPCFVESSIRSLPGVTIAQTSCSPCRATRPPSHLADGNDDVVLCIVTAGSAVMNTKRGEAILCAAGEVYLGPNDVPGGRTFHQPTSFLDIAVRRVVLQREITNSDRLTQRKIGSTSMSALKLLANYVRMLVEDHAPMAPEVASLAAVHVQDLVITALGAKRDAAEVARRRGVRAARLSTIKADIVANLNRSDLTLEKVAARHGITPQYVRALFRSEETTFTDFVRNQRLKRAYRKLTDPRFAGFPISWIAFDSGFNDLSYFNRAFRRRYGMTPSEARAALLP